LASPRSARGDFLVSARQRTGGRHGFSRRVRSAVRTPVSVSDDFADGNKVGTFSLATFSERLAQLLDLRQARPTRETIPEKGEESDPGSWLCNRAPVNLRGLY
jgi:hypothetical protein